VRGLINVQLALRRRSARRGEPAASRTVPFVSKATGAAQRLWRPGDGGGASVGPTRRGDVAA
jgi:hypothetical protein